MPERLASRALRVRSAALQEETSLAKGDCMLGILGGMGPAATTDFMHKVIRLTPANCDQEHLPMIVYGVPQIPDRSAAILGAGADPLPQLLAGIDFLNHAGARLIAIPCNSAHHWYYQLSAKSPAPILHIGRVTATSIASPTGPGVMVLGTRGTVSSGFYQREFIRRGIECIPVNADIQQKVDGCIGQVKAGALEDGARSLRAAVLAATSTSASTVVLGCTELSVASEIAGPMALNVVDSSVELAGAVVRFGLAEGWNRPLGGTGAYA